MGYYLKSTNILAIFKYKCALFAATGEKGRIDLFSNSQEEMGSLCWHKEVIYSLSALPHRTLTSGSDDKTIKIWDIEERSIMSTLSAHSDSVTALCYANEGELVSGSDDKSLIIWSKSAPESSNYSLRQRLTGHTSYIQGIIRMNKEIM